MAMSLKSNEMENLLKGLATSNEAFTSHYPGEPHDRQAVHTIYGGAQLFKSNTAVRIGELAQKSVKTYAPNFCAFAKAMHWPGHESMPNDGDAIAALDGKISGASDEFKNKEPELWLAHSVYHRMCEKLEKEAVEDFRIDFEDGYGNRPDEEEDGDAERTAKEVVKGMQEGTLPPFIGIRIKPFNEQLKERSLRSMDIFISTVLSESGGKLPDNFVVTLPKVSWPQEVAALVEAFEYLEDNNGLAQGTLKLEIMIETTQAIMGPNGQSMLPPLLKAAKGRCIGAHFGTYDYTALCQITAEYQEMDHPACDFALHMMKVAYGNTGIFLSNGATNIMPVGPHNAKDGNLSAEQEAENQDVVHRAWRLSQKHINHSLRHAYYQGWDLHPGQVPVRYSSVYYFFLKGLEQNSLRLKSFMDKAAQATLVGDVFDDAATGQGLLNYFLRGMNCGAISADEALATGLTLDEFKTRSFAKILDMRREAHAS